MSSIKLKHSGGNSVIIAAPSSNPAADRTITCPDLTANAVMATTNGITEYDTWKLTAIFDATSAATDFITGNLARVTTFFEKIGTGMSVSSGVFSFPSTGKWEVQAFFVGDHTSTDNIFKLGMFGTTNNSDYNEIVNSRAMMLPPPNSNGYHWNASFAYLLDITDVSNQKIKFGITTADANLSLDGATNTELDGTYFNFKRIGDT